MSALGDQLGFDRLQPCRQLPAEFEFVLRRTHFLGQRLGGFRVPGDGEVSLNLRDPIAVRRVVCGDWLEFVDPAFRRGQCCAEERSEDLAGGGRLADRPIVHAEAKQTEGFEVLV